MIFEYEAALKKLFTKYYEENFNSKKLTISWKTIEESNLQMDVMAFLKMCRLNLLIPHLLNPETLQDFIRDVVPPRTKNEIEFFKNSDLVLEYEADENFMKSDINTKPNNVKLYFHEFEVILGKIALNCITSEINPLLKLNAFFVERLNLRNRVPSAKSLETLSAGKGVSDEEAEEIKSENEEYVSENEIEDPFHKMEILTKEREDALMKFENPVDFEEILKELNDLPEMPPEQTVAQVNPPPYNMPIMQLGKIKPKSKDDDKKKKKAPPKRKAMRRSNEPPPKPIKWGAKPEPQPPSSYEIFKTEKENMEKPVFPNYSKNAFGNSFVAPCIIKEVLFPPDAPPDVASLLESANTYHANADYELALKCFEEARKSWKSIENKQLLRPEFELFFELSLASVLESFGKDNLALQKFIVAKNVKDLRFNHPDKAIPYCGIGSVLYHLKEYVWACRSYLKAREIREDYLGGDTIDTASTYNNLGCCMMCLKRFKEAEVYFNLSHAILTMELGPLHERSMTAQLNLKKVKHVTLGPIPEFKPLWNIYVIDKNPKKKKGKKKKKSKK